MIRLGVRAMNRRVDYPNAKNKKTVTKTANKKITNHKVAKKNSQSSISKVSADGDRSPTFLLKGWFAHHQFSCRDSLQRLFSAPWQNVMTWMVLAIALVLPSILYLGLHNVQQLGQNWQGNTQMSAYIRHEAKPLAIEQLQQRLLGLPEIESIEFISPEAAKQEFQQYSGLGSVLQSLETNPLPAVLMIRPISTLHDPSQLSALQAQLQAEPLVDVVQLDIGWLRRLQEMMGLAQRIVIVLGLFLALGVLLIIGNTIRLAIENRRNEIVVIKMVGGTDGFVRRPFLYMGFWYGIGGGIVALCALLLTGLWLSAPVQSLASLYDSEYSLTWMSFNYSVMMVLGSGFLGWLGSWIAVSWHLNNIQPE